MKPIIIVPPNTLSQADIKRLRDNELCVVVSKDPAKVKFLDPIPAAGERTKIEAAAIGLSRILLNGTWAGPNLLSRSDFAQLYVELLIAGTPLDKKQTLEERCDTAFELAKLEESRKLAREEAKAQRATKKKLNETINTTNNPGSDQSP